MFIVNISVISFQLLWREEYKYYMRERRSIMAKVFKKPKLVVKQTTVVVSMTKSALCSGGSSHIVADTSNN